VYDFLSELYVTVNAQAEAEAVMVKNSLSQRACSQWWGLLLTIISKA